MAEPLVTDEVVRQAAQQAAQQAGDAVAQSVRSVIDASRTAASQEVGAEREFETGTDEVFKHLNGLTAANAKRTYDEYQHESLSQIRENRQIVDRMAQNSVDHDTQIRNVSLQALQNAVETANMISKRSLQNFELATDRQWNIDEVSGLSAKSAVQADTIQAIVAATVAATLAALNEKK